jgi:hypothetical protein
MGSQEIARVTRQQMRRRVLGKGAACARCGWTDTAALTKTKNTPILCYECRCHTCGRSGLEQHHHLGRAVDPATIPAPGNIHRDLSERQRQWPQEVRDNPQRDPLLWLAAALLGLRDHLSWWLAWLDRIATWFLALSEALVHGHGERWWEMLDLPPVWQEGIP